MNSKQLEYWSKLLHYRKNLVGMTLSQVDSPHFFISKNGRHSPVEELKASVLELNSTRAQDFVCRFPLRYKWLKTVVVNQWNYDPDNCNIYKSFKDKMDAKNLSLVFSSFYINNPGSTFGHTFIHVSRYKEFRTNELLDYAINYAAQETNGENVLMYMLKGLGGFYPGRFSVIPYYYKIREYNDHEFRDIWDYDLDLNQAQVDRVIDHVWEMGENHFDYYYFTENCSYHILGLLNVAYDDLDLLAGLPGLYILPIDTVKELKRLGLIKDKKVRSSAYRKLLKETEDFSLSDLEKIKKVAADSSQIDKLFQLKDDEKSAKVLDATISAIDYLKAEAILTNAKIETEEREKLLYLRATNSFISPDLKFDEKHMPSPDESHHSSRLGMSLGYQDQMGMFESIEWRAAQHELLDPSAGQIKNAQVIMFETKVRLQTQDYSKQRPVIERFRLFDLKKYQASDFWNKSISWDLGIGLDQRPVCASHDCLQPTITFGAGNAITFDEDFVLTFLLGGRYQRDQTYKYDSLLELGPKLNFLILKDKYALGLDMSYFLPTELFDGWGKNNLSYFLDSRYFLSQQVAFFLKAGQLDDGNSKIDQGQVGIYIYH